MKITSNYLDTELEVSTFTDESGEKTIISHAALEDIVHNQIPDEFGTKYEITALSISETHNVFKCVISDNSGRRITGIGESLPVTLESDIAKAYPALIASQRAFDRAVIQYLQFPSKVYSDTEGVTSEIKTDEFPLPNNAPAASSVPKKENTNSANTTDKATETPEDLGSLLYTIGSYKDKNMTLAEVYAENRDSIVWMAEKYKGKTQAGKKLQEACIKYLKLMEG